MWLFLRNRYPKSWDVFITICLGGGTAIIVPRGVGQQTELNQPHESVGQQQGGLWTGSRGHSCGFRGPSWRASAMIIRNAPQYSSHGFGTRCGPCRSKRWRNRMGMLRIATASRKSPKPRSKAESPGPRTTRGWWYPLGAPPRSAREPHGTTFIHFFTPRLSADACRHRDGDPAAVDALGSRAGQRHAGNDPARK